MGISDWKISVFQKLISALADKPNATQGYDAAELKDYWDSSPEELRLALNGLIDNLLNTVLGSSGAENIGSAAIPGIAGDTVYEQLVGLLAVAQAAQAGTILPGVVTDTMLSNLGGMIKARLAAHIADNMMHFLNGALLDANSNELIKTSATNNAVNEITVKNNIAGSAPELQATGDDTNIPLNMKPKGTGRLQEANKNVVLATDGVTNLYMRNNNGALEWSTDNATWNAVGGSGIGSFEFGLPII